MIESFSRGKRDGITVGRAYLQRSIDKSLTVQRKLLRRELPHEHRIGEFVAYTLGRDMAFASHVFITKIKEGVHKDLHGHLPNTITVDRNKNIRS